MRNIVSHNRSVINGKNLREASVESLKDEVKESHEANGAREAQRTVDHKQKPLL